MITYVALFRGINVGGRNVIPMGELAEALEGLALQKIKTYIQSGNVAFQYERTDPAELSDRIKGAISESHGITPQVILLELGELEEAIALNPFPEAESEPKTLYLYFLEAAPTNPDLNAIESIRRESERYKLKGKVFYLHAPDGIGRSKLAAQIERSLGTAATGRNWRSVGKILAMAKEIK